MVGPTRLIIHADDVGMCHGANVAFVELARLGVITSGSVMVPCPWFAEIAAIAAGDPALDVGVHLTLTSEHRGYRWGPVSRAGRSSGLVDDQGYLWPDVISVRRHGHPDAVETELRAQIDRALGAGIDITHLDAHMGAALAPEWCDRYLRVGLDYGVPVLIAASLSAYGPSGHLAGVDDDRFAPFVAAAREAGFPVVDRVVETDFSRPAARRVEYRDVLGAVTGGRVFCAFHPCAPGPGEIEAIEPDQCHVRLEEYAAFRERGWAAWLAGRGFVLEGFRTIRDDWRSARP